VLFRSTILSSLPSAPLKRKPHSAKIKSLLQVLLRSRENKLTTLALPSVQHQNESSRDTDTHYCFTQLQLPELKTAGKVGLVEPSAIAGVLMLRMGE
jgi:hypothetical protein